MQPTEIAPFYVGQEVVAIKDHSQGHWKKGDEFVVRSIKKNPCCGIWAIDIGIRTSYSLIGCACNHLRRNDEHYLARSFAPKHKFGEFISMKELAERQLEIVGAN